MTRITAAVAFSTLVAASTLIAAADVQQPSGAAALPYLAGQSETDIVDAAEQEALAFPTSPRPPARLRAVFAAERTAGTSERTCVAGVGTGPVRSGEFVIGGELSGPRLRGAAGSETRARKIWWSPLHHSADMQLLVRARRVGSDEEYRFHSPTVAWSSRGPDEDAPEDEREYFFPSGIEFLRDGRWVVVATQRADWGCFVLTLPAD